MDFGGQSDVSCPSRNEDAMNWHLITAVATEITHIDMLLIF